MRSTLCVESLEMKQTAVDRLAWGRASKPAAQAGVGYLWATPAPAVSPQPSSRIRRLFSNLSCCCEDCLETSMAQSQHSGEDKPEEMVSQFRPADCQWRHSPTWSCYKEFPEIEV